MNITATPTSKVVQLSPDHWLLSISEGAHYNYRLAQIDDYQDKIRSAFPWQPPVSLSLKARSSIINIPGTWGFGFWNDPFRFSIKLAKAMFRLPALPNAIWYFFAAPENYLSLSTHLPANGQMAATYRSMNINPIFISLSIPFLPLASIPPLGRAIRRIGQGYIKQDGISMLHDPTKWHHYQINWRRYEAVFYLDGNKVFHTEIVPKSPLGLVIWIDNQFAALHPKGKIGFGTLANNNPASIEIQDLIITQLKE